MATGIEIKKEKDELSWKYKWRENENYKLMIATAGDSAGNFSLYSGYIFLPKEKPATFPLKRLIMGWQIGVPLCKIGGKIKIIIPSNLAYSIRTRAAKIPPNSILVFEIEVVDARAPVN